MKTLRDQVHLIYAQCCKRYPSVHLSFEVFRERIEEIVASRGDLEEGGRNRPEFSRLHHQDLFLAMACSHGDRIAWEHFVDEFVPTLRRQAGFSCRNADAGEDLAQEIITSLLREGEEQAGERGKLAGYNGRGALAGWLRVVVANAAIDRIRRAKKQVPLNDEERLRSASSPAAASADEGGTSDRLDSRWGPVLSTVLAAEIRALSSKDRLLLSLYYLQEVPLHAIGRHFGVHEATASRWIASVRKGIRRRVEKRLRKKHGLSPGDIRSVWHWITEAESFSLSGLLQMREEPVENQGK